MFRCAQSFGIVISQLVDGHDLPIMGEHQKSKDGRGNDSHCIHITTSKEKVVIELGIENLDVNQHSFTNYHNRDIREDALGLINTTIIATKGIGRMLKGWGSDFLPNKG